jgi:predicted dehydrogenase
MTRRVAVAILGGGLISQLEHLPNLLALPGHFEVRGLADPSARVRDHLASLYKVPVFAAVGDLLEQPLEAVVIATPDGYHVEQTLSALERGLHVFCEKPLGYALDDLDRLAAKRDAAGRVVQVGYMKRCDPSYLLLRDLVRGRGQSLRMISVEVNNPEFWPFVAHRSYLGGGDLPAGLIEESAARIREQVARALGAPIAGTDLKGFIDPYCSSMVHDVNVVHGLLDALGVSTGELVGAAIFAGGEGAQATVRLSNGGLWAVSHLTVPRLADYHERVTLHFDDSVFELGFPSPYLNHHPTSLLEKRSQGHHAQYVHHRTSYLEPFVEEMRAWHAAIVGERPPINPIEEARRDMALLAAFGRRAVGLET